MNEMNVRKTKTRKTMEATQPRRLHRILGETATFYTKVNGKTFLKLSTKRSLAFSLVDYIAS